MLRGTDNSKSSLTRMRPNLPTLSATAADRAAIPDGETDMRAVLDDVLFPLPIGCARLVSVFVRRRI